MKRTAPRISGGRTREFARVGGRPLKPRDSRRVAPSSMRMVIRGADGAARSVRAIVWLQARGDRVALKAVVERSRYAAAKNLKTVYTPIFAQFRALIEKECTP